MFTQLLSLSTGQGSFYLSTGANSYMLILGHKKESMHKIVYIMDPLRWGSWYFYNCNSIPFIGKWVLLTLMHWKCEKPTYAPQTAFKSVFCSSFPHLLCRVAVTSTQPNQALSAAFFFWPWAPPAPCSTIRDAMLGCCSDSVKPRARGRSSTKSQVLIHLQMSLTYNAGDEKTWRRLTYDTGMRFCMHRSLTSQKALRRC